MACYGESLQVVIDEAYCSIQIHQLGDGTGLNSSSKLVVSSYRWHQCIDGNNQPSIYQTSSTKPPHFYVISTIGDPFIRYLYNDWDSRSFFERRVCQAYWGI